MDYQVTIFHYVVWFEIIVCAQHYLKFYSVIYK